VEDVKILLLAKEGDWSGASKALCDAINSNTEHEAHQIAMSSYYTGYKADILSPSKEKLAELLDWADVWALQDNADEIIPANMKRKPCIYTYHGTYYRQNYPSVNRKHKGAIQTCLTQDLSRFGPIWLGRAQEDLSLSFGPSREFVVSHAPTKRGQKGTAEIEAALKGIEGVTLDIIEGVSNEACLKRKAKSSVYVDQVGGAAIGYGTNSLEAWALGMPVISYAPPAIEAKIIESVGYLPYYRASTEEEIREAVLELRDDQVAYEQWRGIGRKYLEDFHSPRLVAESFIQLCEDAMKVGVVTQQSASVSVCLIVKNEEKYLESAVESTRGLADEVVVVDTGSEDSTIEIATRLGCKILTGGDPMNKGASRNMAIDAATSDWVVILDADEKIADPVGLKAFLSSTDCNAVFIREAYMNAANEQTLAYAQMRAWPKNDFRYRYRAHEIPVSCCSSSKSAYTNFLFEHRPAPEKMTWKLQYTLDRLLLDTQEHPGDPRPQYYLGRQYMYVREYDKAIETLKGFLDMPNAALDWDRVNACGDLSACYKALGNSDQHVKWLYLAALEQPMNRDRWFSLGCAYYDLNQFYTAAGFLRHAMEIPQSKEVGYLHPELHGFVVYDKLAMCLWHLKRYQEGLECALTALSYKLDDKRLSENVGWFRRELAK
jgi:glycosyltransferase involved in cell wall biosynthesis